MTKTTLLIRLCLTLALVTFTSVTKDSYGLVHKPKESNFESKERCPDIEVHPERISNGQVGESYDKRITATPAGGNYSFSVTSGQLPPGLTLNPNGLFSGAPTQRGTFNFRITASGYGTCKGSRDYTVRVK